MHRVGILLCLAATIPCPSQTDDGSVPASSNVLNAQYPRIHPDLRVTFRVNAPAAQKVQVTPTGGANGLGKGPFDMQKDEKGMWTVTIPPAEPGFHYYNLIIDGFAANDPCSETYFGWARQNSGIEIPDKSFDFYDLKDVPHGDVRMHWYRSKVTGAWRRAFVYVPPGYDLDARKRYPVLYLQHGSGESERGWTAQGRANFILDNLIAAGRATPMIVVMDHGYATKTGAPEPPAPGGGPGRGNSAFPQMVIEDLVPEIDRGFRTIANRENRAIAGLSMGAGQAMQIGFSNLEKFAYIGSFSGGMRNFDPKTSFGGAFSDPSVFNKKVKLFWIGSGAEDNFYAGAKDIHKKLEETGIRSVWFECPGGHEWQAWRKSLHDFAPRLFRN